MSPKTTSYKPQAASVKPEDLHATNTASFKLDRSCWGLPRVIKPQAPSFKHQAEKKNPKVQAPSSKLQAASDKLHNFFALIKFHATRSEVLC